MSGIPESSKVQQYSKAGRLSTVLQQATIPTPRPGPGEILLKVKAVGLNPVDEQIAQSPPWLLRFMGAKVSPPSERKPWTPAKDFAGVVAEVGSGVTEWKVGDEVHGMQLAPCDGTGVLQEYIVVPPSWAIAPKPSNLSFAEAAALPLVYMTVYTGLITHGRIPFSTTATSLSAGAGGRGKQRSLLVLGGSSGTGSVAVQMGKKLGLKVVASCSTKNIDFVRSLGADEVIDYTKNDVPQTALKSPHARYDVVFDCVGGTEVVKHIDEILVNDPSNPDRGVYVTIVGDKTSRDAMGGPITTWLYPWQAIRTIRSKLQDYAPQWTPLRSYITGKRYICMALQPTSETLRTVPEFLKSAEKVIIDSMWTFEDSTKAFEKLESSRAVGKVVIEL